MKKDTDPQMISRRVILQGLALGGFAVSCNPSSASPTRSCPGEPDAGSPDVGGLDAATPDAGGLDATIADVAIADAGMRPPDDVGGGGTTLNILMDSLSTQVLYQQAASVLPPDPGTFPTATGHRINTILGAMEGAGVTSGRPWAVSFSSYPITPAQLADINVYVSMTRWLGPAFAYQSSELDALEAFVHNGGGLLLLTNHGPFDGNPTDWPVNDIALAARFGIELHGVGVSESNYMVMTLDSATPTPPPYIAGLVQGIASHDSCVIVPPAGFTSLARFPSGAVEWNGSTNVTPASPYFAILVPHGSGYVIVVGNSGMFADYGTPQPSCGLVPMQNNLLFFLNCVGYLGGLRTPPVPGACPST